MLPMRGNPKWICGALAALLAVAAPRPTRGVEVVVQNDSLLPGGTGNIQAGFDPGESAAVWLTSPCDGTIVAVQVFWRSLFGGASPSLEDNIIIHNAGTFPVPGAVLAFLEGPLMTDGVLNEFRYLDENNTVPINVPVVRNQVFVVAFTFYNDPSPLFGPSVVTDTGCQAGKNSIFANGIGWVNSCALGVTGDFVIRAVVDCPVQQGACCLPNGNCELRSEAECINANGFYWGNGTSCTPGICNGACCLPDGTCSQLSQSQCAANSGSFKGVSVACTAGLCRGACCLPNGGCANSQSPNECAAAGGAYKGDGTNCASVSCTGACCYPNGSCQNQTLAQCGGEWNGPNSNCGSTNCPVRGACCMPDGSCMDNQLASECAAMGGVYKGDNTTCASNPCVGACCFGGSCLNLTKTDCQQITGSTWQGPAYQCASGNSCPTGACCTPLGDCVANATPVACQQLGGAFHLGQTCAAANCPIPVGACCFNNGTSCIANLQPQQCQLIAGSTWNGPNSQCAATCCPPPKGDFNADSRVDGLDIRPFVNALLGTPTPAEICRGDFDLDAALGSGDVPGMVDALLTWP